MSGLRKQKQYDWKDTNLALIGSDTDRNVKKESAETEPAWKGAGSKVGIKIWRIQKFKVVDTPVEDYGSFFNGDSYIILNTYKDTKEHKNSEELAHDVHFWIGKNSTNDEYGTAAYKTVELDAFLDDKPIQHREVEGHESDLFKSYFKVINYWEGGHDTGFKYVEPTSYKPRLLQVHSTKKSTVIKEKSMCMDCMTDCDVCILDYGLKIYQVNGVSAAQREKYEAGKNIVKIRSSRGGKPNVEVLDNWEKSKGFDEDLNIIIAEHADEEPGTAFDCDEEPENVLILLSDRMGSLKQEEIARGPAVKESLLRSDDVFILDTGRACWVWVGLGASIDERRKAMTYAHNYLMTTSHPLVPISCIKQGKEPVAFHKAF